MTDQSPDHAERAALVRRLRAKAKRDASRHESTIEWQAAAMIEALSAALRGRDAVVEARAAVARCVEIVRAQQQDFLSEQYATPQPLGSFAERFACGQCMDAIMDEFAMGSNEQRALIGRPSHGEEYRAALNTGDRP